MIPLAPIDYYFARPSVLATQFIFCFDGTVDEERLRYSLRKSLTYFPPLRSRLVRVGETDLSLKADDAALESTVDFATRVVDDLNLDGMDPLLQWVDPVTTAENELLFKIVLNKSTTRTYLSVSMSHALGDVYSLVCFLVAWAKTYQGGTFDPPSCDRSVLDDRLVTSYDQLTSEIIFRDTGYVLSTPDARKPSKLKKETLKFSASDLDYLKRKTEAEERGLSLNDVLAAHLLKRFHVYVMSSEDSTVIVRCPVDFRRLHPNLSSRYFGNAFRDAVVEFDKNVLQRMSVGEVALRIRRAVSEIDARNVLRSLSCFNQLRMKFGLDFFYATF
ncbi:MAG: acyltransferase [Nitrospiraceae bacterium]